METTEQTKGRQCIAFAGVKAIANGALSEVAEKTKEYLESDNSDSILIFDCATSEPIEIDFRGCKNDVLQRLNKSSVNVEGLTADPDTKDGTRGPGRPKLGVVAREVTLLPRHWEWLQSQPGGASVVLRKLVEEARRQTSSADTVRTAKEVTYKFMSAMAGNLPHFEEATRALFGNDRAKFAECIADWPSDLRGHIQSVSSPAFNALQ